MAHLAAHSDTGDNGTKEPDDPPAGATTRRKAAWAAVAVAVLVVFVVLQLTDVVGTGSQARRTRDDRGTWPFATHDDIHPIVAIIIHMVTNELLSVVCHVLLAGGRFRVTP